MIVTLEVPDADVPNLCKKANACKIVLLKNPFVLVTVNVVFCVINMSVEKQHHDIRKSETLDLALQRTRTI